MKAHFSYKSQGFTLVELMVAVAVGLLLMTGVIQLFAQSRTTYQLTEGMARTQESARFAMEFLQRDLRMVGHFGCTNDQSLLRTSGAITNHFTGNHDALDFTISIQAYEASGTSPEDQVTLGGSRSGSWAPSLPASISGLQPAPLAGSDILVLRYLANEGVPVENIQVSGSKTTFTVSSERWSAFTQDGVSSPSIFGVADCTYADLFSASSIDGGNVSVNKTIERHTAQPGGQSALYRAESLVYYVATGAGGTEPSLYRARFNGGNGYQVPEELVEGVESLQLLFGQDSTQDLASAAPSGYINIYNTADTIGTSANDWRRVGAAQLGLIMRSPANAAAAVPSDGNEVYALGVRFNTPANNDGRYRAAYETTVALRNRLYGN